MSGRSSGKCSAMTLKNLERETELNWLVRLKKTAALVGDWFVHWCALMNFSIASCIALTTKDMPSGMPTA